MTGMRYQPQGRVVINLSNSLAVGLVSAVTGGMVELRGAGPSGLHMLRDVQGGYEDPIVVRLNNPLINIDGFTFMTVVRQIGLENTRFAMRFRASGNTNDLTRPYIGYNSSGISFNFPGGILRYAIPVSSDADMVIVGTWDKANNVALLFLNGVIVGSAEIGANSMPTATSTGTALYHADANSSQINTTFLPYLNTVHTRALSINEVVRASGNPWQIFVQPEEEYSSSFVASPVTPVNLTLLPAVVGVLTSLGLLNQARNLGLLTTEVSVAGLTSTRSQAMNLGLSTVAVAATAGEAGRNQARTVFMGTVDAPVTGYAPSVTQENVTLVRPVDLTMQVCGVPVVGIAPMLSRGRSLTLGTVSVPMTSLQGQVARARNLAMQVTTVKLRQQAIAAYHPVKVSLKIDSSGKLRTYNGKILLN